MSTAGDHGRDDVGSLNNRDRESWNTRKPAGNSSNSLLNGPYLIMSIVLYFYTKADTPGCTKESCEFRDTSQKLSAVNTVVVGVSPDTSKAQAKFKAKFDLPFLLLADTEHKAAEAYGFWKEKSMYGK